MIKQNGDQPTFSMKSQSCINKYIWLCRSHSLCCNYSSRPLNRESSCRWHVSKWAWPCANKTLLTKTVRGLANAEPLSVSWRGIVWASGSQRVVLGLPSSASPGNLLEIHILGSLPQAFWTRNPGVGPRNLCFSKSSTWFCYMLKFKFWSNSFSICILAAYLVPKDTFPYSPLQGDCEFLPAPGELSTCRCGGESKRTRIRSGTWRCHWVNIILW